MGELTTGKRVFLNFFAPWCGHCKRLKPAWDKLMQEYSEHPSILVAEVDCAGGGKSKCDEWGVEGTPTLKYGDPNNLEDYKGARDLDALRNFTEESLGPICSPDRMDLCDEEKKEKLDEFMAMPMSELKFKIKKQEDLIVSAEKELKGFFEKIQRRYNEAEVAKAKKEKAIKDAGLGLMKAVQAYNRQRASGDAQAGAKGGAAQPRGHEGFAEL
ncbi:unnamed protein product [Effrenium voratum]|uniref:Thioredoxin domain-containing protein n=1 Tax=Effrenium voratum TaxID=2562239 RepID=A0AA36ILY0_9DINO|nr:unnamed protein product [Effrenium voratum]